MNIANIFILILLIGALVWSLLWAFKAFRAIETQKNFNAQPLTSIAKLWRRANFVPEDAKERESLYLYRDFLRKFEDIDCKYPVIVKNGGVRAMTRKEYDNACGLKNQRPFSLILMALSVLIFVLALAFNIPKNVGLGIGLALVMPVVQGVLAFILVRMNKEKDTFREAIFMAIKENSVAFLSITKPFVIVDAYPSRFGKNSEPLYTTKGELSDEQVEETRQYVIQQKESETKVVVQQANQTVDNLDIIEPAPKAATPEPSPAETEPTAPAPETPTTETPATEAPAEATNPDPTEAAQPAEEATNQVADEDLPLTEEEKDNLIHNLIEDTLLAEVDRAIKKATRKKQEQEQEVIEELPPLPTDAVSETVPAVEAPAEDDFSLDAIGQALDAEIAKRNQRK